MRKTENNFIYEYVLFAVKPGIIYFVGGPEKERWILENEICGVLYKIRFVQGPQKLKDGFGKRYIREGQIEVSISESICPVRIVTVVMLLT
jgi:hypothetical protein